MENNKDVGEYVSHLINENFESDRAFCKAYLRLNGQVVNDDLVKNLANRVSQIKNGNKSIQTYDLPLYSKLLGASSDEILSAGKNLAPAKERLTNYSVALSNDKSVWTAYINHKDKPILNADEYCKTSIDYAIQFNNIDFIEYLIDNGIIWFDCKDRNNYLLSFGAGTKIKGRNIGDVDYYMPQELCNEKLRMKLAALAVRNNNTNILEALRAREIPELYNLMHFVDNGMDLKIYNYHGLVADIACASEEIVTYFTSEFAIGDLIKNGGKEKASRGFMFPFIPSLLDKLIKDNSDYTVPSIKNAIHHNKNAYAELTSLIKKITDDETAVYNFGDENYFKKMKAEYREKILREIHFDKSGNFITLRDMVTNIVHVSSDSENAEIKSLVDELNASYDKIVSIKV